MCEKTKVQRLNIIIIGASLSKPYTSENNGMNIAFTKVYMEIRIRGMRSCIHKSLCLKIG